MLTLHLLSTLTVLGSVSAFSFNTTFDYRLNGVLVNLAEQFAALDPTSTCLKQFVSDIDCNDILFAMEISPSQNVPNATALAKGCTTNCEQSLAGWIDKTWSVCQQGQNSAVKQYFQTTSEEQFMIRYFWGLCLRDLTNNTFCYLQNNPVNIDRTEASRLSQSQIDAACKDTCFTQRSAMQWHAYEQQNNTAGVLVANVADICPNVDTSSYAVVAPLSQVAAGDAPASSSTSSAPSSTRTSSSSTSSSPATTTSAGAASATTTKPSSGAAITASYFMPFVLFLTALTFL